MCVIANSFINPYSAYIFCIKNICILHLLHTFRCIPTTFIMEANTMNSDQTAPKWAVWSGSILFAIWAVTWDFQQCGMCNQQCFRSACAYVQSVQSFCWSLEYPISVKLLTEHHLEFLSLKGGCTGSSESTLVKMPHCLKSHVAARIGYQST